MTIVISGIGTAVPEHSINQVAAGMGAVPFCCDTPEQGRVLEALFRRSGVETRHSVVLHKSAGHGDLMENCQEFYSTRTDLAPRGPTTAERMRQFESAAGPLALRAANLALARAGLDPSVVTHLITVTCSGFSAPGFDYSLISQLPLKRGVSRTQIGFMGCHAALNACRVARAFVTAEPQSVVLICCVELCTLHYQYGWDPEQIVAMSLFSDGAAACIVQSSQSVHTSDAAPDNSTMPDCSQTGDQGRSTIQYELLANGACLLPDSDDAMTWRLSDHGFRMTLSPRVPELISRHLMPWLESWLGTYGYQPADIGEWAVHPGGPKILQAFTDAARLEPQSVQTSREILRRFGNMSSATLMFILDALRPAVAARPTVALGFGPGLAIEAALLLPQKRISTRME